MNEEKVVEGCRGDGGNTKPIASDRDRMSESGKLNGAVFSWQRGTHRTIKPEVEGEENDEQQAQDRYDRTKQEF